MPRSSIPGRLLATTVVALLALVSTGLGSAFGSSTTDAMAPLCQTPGLVVWLNTEGNGAAGR